MKQYPKQIACLHGNKNSLDIQAEMVKVNEEGNDSPLEMHRGALSRFVLTLKDSGGFTVSNIPAWDVAAIVEKTRAVTSKTVTGKILNEAVLERLKEKASVGEKIEPEELEELTAASKVSPEIYTYSIPLCGSKTAAEMVIDEGLARAMSQEQYIRKLSLKETGFQERNKKEARLLKEAIDLYQEGKLSERDPNALSIYSAGPKPRLSKTDKDGNSQVYSVKIVYHQGRNFPWEVAISNWWAKVDKIEDGSLRVGSKASTGNATKRINLSDSDYYGMIHRMERTLEMFENSIFDEMFEMSQKYAWKPES